MYYNDSGSAEMELGEAKSFFDGPLLSVILYISFQLSYIYILALHSTT